MQWNLEQIRLFVSVAERQSFSAAARELKRVQSAVSNGIALLEADLGVTLFERSSGRQPRLTDEGRVLLAEARRCCASASACRGARWGWRAARAAAAPGPGRGDALPAGAGQPGSAGAALPSLEVQVSSGGQGDVTRRLLEEQADLGLLFHHERMPESLERRRLGSVEMVTVCGAGHPLAGLQRVSRRELAQHRQLLIVPQQSGYPGGEQISPQVWRLDSFYSMAELLMRNLGWAWLPRHVVQYPTYDRLMVELTSDWMPPALVVELVWRRNEVLGPAAAWLGETFTRHLRAIG